MESVGATKDVTPGAIEFERVVRELKEKLAESEGARRKLHNQIQDLKVCLHVMSRLTDPHVVIIIGHRLRSPPPSLSLSFRSALALPPDNAFMDPFVYTLL
jgi:hypothetical protein